SRIGRLPVVLANTIASMPASPDGVSIVATSAAVRQNVGEKRFARRPRSVIVASAIGMELCLNPSVCVTTRTREGGSIELGEVPGPSPEHDAITTPAASPHSQPAFALNHER